MIRFNKSIFYLVFMVLLMYGSSAFGQRFKASALLGLNFAQIDGDDLYGYNKVGLTGGFKLGYPIMKTIDANLEMIYSQRGSNSGFGFGKSNDNYTSLSYLSLPIYATYKDWHIEDGDYHKVNVQGGLTYSFLFDVDTANGNFSNDIDNYTRHNIGFLLGVGYFFTPHVGFSLRYTRELNSIFVTTARSYFLTLQLEYAF